MSGAMPKPTSSPQRQRRIRRLAITALPTTVWLLAIVAAFQLYHRLSTARTVTGHARDALVTVAHLEQGVVRKVQVDLYEHVAPGQVLMAMDDSEERILLAGIEKDIERLTADVTAERARILADNARAVADFEDLARRFAIDREAAHVDYLARFAEDARNRALLRGAEIEYQLVRSLYEQGNAPRREFNDIKTEVDSLRTAIERNAGVLEREKQAFEETDRRWIQFVDKEGIAAPYEPVLTPLRLAIEVRRRDLEEIVRRIDSHVIRAPIGGQVASLLAQAGDRVQAGTPLASISPTATGEVVVYLSEGLALTAQVGAPVSVTPLASATGAKRQYAGTIVSLSPVVEEAPPRYRALPNYPVWGRGLVVALNDGMHLVPGEAVTIAFLGQR
ncbi:MAG: HlyD family secretion protein [Planctomycetota bacterium]|jgi:membrane fusion protein (multidrug efflux system)